MNTKQRTTALLILVMSLVISGCGPGKLFGPALTPTPTITPTQTPTITPSQTPTQTPSPTSTPVPPFIVDKTGLTIDGIAIPLQPRIQDFTAVLGEPSRTLKLEHGTVYVYDDLGITYRTNVGSDHVSDLTLYCKDMSDVFSFSPVQQFHKPLIVAGKSFPFGKSIADVIRAIPEITQDPQGFGILYSGFFGQEKIKLTIEIDASTSEIETIDISFQGWF
ncbi:MAG: hypothetical protein ABSC61_11145 [Anaerolineales bacterium]